MMKAASLASGRKRRWLPELCIAIILLVAPLVLPWIGFNSDTLSRILVWGLFGIGFDLLFGFTGLLSFGQSAFFGLGGFVCSYLVVSGVISNVWLGMLIGIVASMAYGVVVGLLSLRRTGIYFAMITLAFGELSFFLENSPLQKFTGGENGLAGVPTPHINLGFFNYDISIGWPLYWLIALIFWIGFVFARQIIRSPFGVVLVSILKNAPRSVALGHRIQAYKLAVFVIAAAYSGLAGALLGILQGYMPPDAFNLDTSTQLVVQTLIGGAGTLVGPLVGAVIWIWLLNVLQFIPFVGVVWKLILGVIFVVLIVAFRGGICGEIANRWKQKHEARIRQSNDLESGPHDKPCLASPEPDAEHGNAVAPIVQDVPAVAAAPSQAHASNAQRLDSRSADNADAAPVLEARGLTKHYGGVHAVTGVDLVIREGEFRAIIGPNGAGKSTFFKMLSGEITPTSGDVFLREKRVTGCGATAMSQHGVCKSYQINQLFGGLTVWQNVLIPVLARLRGSFRFDVIGDAGHLANASELVQETLAMVGLTDRAQTRVDVLAYGEKRRLEVGLALATEPSILLLDEPLAGMSPEERVDIKRLLRKVHVGRTVVIIEHDMDAVFELADRVSVLSQGTLLAEGSPAEIRGSQSVQSAYLGGMDENEFA